MTISTRTWAYVALGAIGIAAAIPVARLITPTAHDLLSARDATAETGAVDLRAQWTRATGDSPLDARFLQTYLPSSEDTSAADAGTGDPFGLDVETQIEGAEAGTVTLLSMPIISVSPEDARQLARREAALSLYLHKYTAWRALLAQNAQTARAPEADHLQFMLQATAAHLELFVLASIQLEAGETQPLKCQARDRAAQHALAVGFERTTPGDVVQTWQPLLSLARRVFKERYARFDTRFCTFARPLTRAETRARVDAKLTDRLKTQVERYLDKQFDIQEGVRKEITALFEDHRIEFPRAEIDELTTRVQNARTAYDTVKTDALGLEKVLGDLEKAAQQLNDPNPQTVFKGAYDKLLDSHASITHFLRLAKNLARISSLNDTERAELAVCDSLPDAFETPVNASTTLASAVGSCLSHAVALRERLLASGGTVLPEHDHFMREVIGLSKAYLSPNPL